MEREPTLQVDVGDRCDYSVQKLPEIDSASHKSADKHTYTTPCRTRTLEQLLETSRKAPNREVRQVQVAERIGHPLSPNVSGKEGGSRENVRDDPTTRQEFEDDLEFAEACDVELARLG